ncbi:MAG: pilus assembly protein PilM [Chloroflexota bacterium]
MAKRVTTLYIRDTAINLLVMKGRQVEKWASLPLEPGLVSQGLIVDEARVAEEVKQLFKREKVSTDKVITASSGHDSLYRIITLPELPEAILPEAVRREAKRVIPTPLEEVYFSYQHLPAEKGEGRIFLASFPRNLTDALIRTLRQAGIRPYIMDLSPLALCRIPNEPKAIIVNARLDHMDVIVIADRLPQVIRRLSLPSEAESLEEKLPSIAEEFNRTVAFYNSSHMKSPLDSTVPVFVCGDLVEAPETWQSVVGQSGYSVSALPSPVESPEGFDPNKFMVNIGLAFKELQSEKGEANFSIVNFNTLPEAYLPERFSIVRVLVPVGIVIGIGLIILGLILIQGNRSEIEALRSQLTSTESRVARLQRETATLSAQLGPIEATADELNTRVVTMERGRAQIAEDLSEIDRLAGETITLSNVSHAGSSVTVNGRASDEDAVFSYADNLRKSGIFSSVWISSITGGESGFTFAFSLTK